MYFCCSAMRLSTARLVQAVRLLIRVFFLLFYSRECPSRSFYLFPLLMFSSSLVEKWSLNHFASTTIECYLRRSLVFSEYGTQKASPVFSPLYVFKPVSFGPREVLRLHRKKRHYPILSLLEKYHFQMLLRSHV